MLGVFFIRNQYGCKTGCKHIQIPVHKLIGSMIKLSVKPSAISSEHVDPLQDDQVKVAFNSIASVYTSLSSLTVNE